MSEPRCKHSISYWYDDGERIMCTECDSEVENDANKVMYKGKVVELGGQPTDYGSGRNPRCCSKARVGRFYFCVCASRSYCPDHGVRCNGTHN